MTSVQVLFKGFADVQVFNSAAGKAKYDIDVISGRYVIDAKSLMGLYSLSLDKPITVKADTDDASDFLDEIADFIVK